MADEPLGDRAARVIGHHHHVVKLERVDEVGDDPGEPRQRHVRVRAQRVRVRAERKVRHDTPVVLREHRRDRPPEVAVHADPVHENERLPAAALAVRDGPRSG
jgi:hypothetical protein